MNKAISEKKIVLSERMRSIVNMLKLEAQKDGIIPGVLDIGCDHAFVSIACIKEAIAKHVIAVDVRKGPLEIAQSNIQMFGMEKSVETRLSDGFEQVEPHEASWAVIAGMGGELMRNILQKGKQHLDAGIGLILQPQSEPDAVRYLLSEQKYVITDEMFLQEDGKFYTIIKAKKGTENIYLEEVEAIYGPVLLQRMEPLFADYLQSERKKKQQLFDVLSEKDTQSARLRCKTLKQEIAMLSDIGRR